MGLGVQACDASHWCEEVGWYLWAQGLPDLHRELQARRPYTVGSCVKTKIQKEPNQHLHWSSLLSYFFSFMEVSKINYHLVSYKVQYSCDVIYLRSFIIDCFTAQYFMP